MTEWQNWVSEWARLMKKNSKEKLKEKREIDSIYVIEKWWEVMIIYFS